MRGGGVTESDNYHSFISIRDGKVTENKNDEGAKRKKKAEGRNGNGGSWKTELMKRKKTKRKKDDLLG